MRKGNEKEQNGERGPDAGCDVPPGEERERGSM